MKPHFQQILTELHQLHLQIRLKLPTSLRGVQQQLHHLSRIQERLDLLQEEVIDQFGAGVISSTYLAYLTLTQLIQVLRQDVITLKHLAEEYPLDPEGSTACLQEMPKHTSNLLTRIRPTHDTHRRFLLNLTQSANTQESKAIRA